MPGRYIVIEGHDGTGKSLQRDLLVSKLMNEGVSTIGVHEPGETPIGLELEKLIKDRTLGRSALTNLLLFTANRVELWEQVIRPALAAGTHVIADRNWISSAAYQGYAEGLGVEEAIAITQRFLPDEYVHPHLTIFLSVTEENRQQRIGNRGGAEADTFESKGDSFQQKVLDGYQKVAPTITNLVQISADPPPEEVHQNILEHVQPLL
jgi:dTMP kinase